MLAFHPGRAALLAAPTDPDALAWRRAVLAQGGTVSQAQLARIARLARTLKARGVWQRLDRLWIFAAETAPQALTDLCTRSLATLSPTPPGFTALRGFAGNAASAYIDLGVAASALTKYAQSAAHQMVYIRDGDGTTNLWVGARDSGSGFSSDCAFGAAATMSFVLQSSSVGTSFSQGAQNGIHIAERTGSATGIVSNNGKDEAPQAVAASASRATSNLTILARNSSGSYAQHSGSRVAAVSFGGALDVSGRAALAAAVNGYMASVGANTY